MRAERLIASGLIALFFCWTFDHDGDPSIGITSATTTAADTPADDIVQRTCALEVILRTVAFEDPVAFGLAVDETMAPLNDPPDERVLACR